MIRSLVSTAGLALVLAHLPVDAAPQSTSPPLPATGLDPALVAPLLATADLSLQLLEFLPSAAAPELLVEIAAGASTWTLALEPCSLRSDHFAVLVDDGTGALLPHPAPPIETRRGRVLEVPGSTVRASFDGVRLRATIEAGGETWIVQPLSDGGIAVAEPWHAVHRAADALPSPHACGAAGFHRAGLAGGAALPFGGATLALAEIAADADFEFFSLNGSSVDDTVHDIEALLNSVEGLFDDDPVAIGYELTAVVVRTASADPYGAESNPGTILTAMEGVWSAPPESAIPRDVTHLFTGVVLAGALVGTSNLSEICTAEAVGLSRSRFSPNWAQRVALTAHELGHNWSASHCDGDSPCRVLCSTIGGCDGLSPLAFEPLSADAIVDYRNSRSCLSTRPPAVALPILDEFTASAIDPELWIHVDGAIVSSQGIAEPSAPNSLALDATGPGPFDRDEIRSNRILLAGTSEPVLAFSVEHRGVEAGEELVVEYLDHFLHWRELDRIASDGIDQSAYVERSYLLPADARHDGFRVRFRAEVDAPDDDWYLDDLTIESGGALGVLFIRGDANRDGLLDIGDAVAILGHLFGAAPAACLDALDANDDGSGDIADAISLLGFLFSAGPPPPAPHPGAGADPTADALDCAS